MFRFLCLVAFFSLGLITEVWAQGFETNATSAVILDQDSGLVLYEKNARDPMPPASMTKIMTAQIIFEALRSGEITEQTMFRVSEEAWRRGGAASGSSTMFLDVNSEVAVADLLKGVIIQSGNDACITLAEGLSGSEDAFARRMTDRAREMGLSSATFLNSTGWPDPGHEISAVDLAKLTRQQINDFPDRYALYAEDSFEWNGIRQGNRNPLLGRFTGADGVKTGSTSVSGYGLVGSAERDGERRIIVINGLPSQAARRSTAIEIMEAAFRRFEVTDLFDAGTNVGEIPVYMGTSETVSLVLADSVTVGTLRSERDRITARIEYKVAPAPIAEGDELASLIITKPNGETQSSPLYAASSVDRKGFFGRVGASILRKIRGQ